MQHTQSNNGSREELLKQLFQTYIVGIRSFKATKPRKWLEEKGLSYDDLSVGFSSGQFSHRKSEEFKQQYVNIGVLKPSKAAVREPHLKAYTCFGNYAIVFPLKNKEEQTTNLFAIRIDTKVEKTEYLNDEGLYPGYPSALTKRLYITSDILSAASLLQAKVLDNRDAVMALHDGELKQQHVEAIRELKQVEQIIFIKNN